MIFGIFTLIVALFISAIAAFYSIAGLAAIFSSAVVPIIIMGAALEIGKITAAVWLKLNWSRTKWTYKAYLVPAVIILMLLTSMGIFGFLSKSHNDHSLITGTNADKIALYDEKIKIQKDNIDVARKTLAQLDAQVNERLSRGTSEQSVERSAALRRMQQKERATLLKDIEAAQKEIQKLNEERAPLASEFRKIEAEVGPIKYIAALIYGPNPDSNLLEKAVSWMIIVIVIVFDPLALVLILAAQQSLRWHKEEKVQAEQAKSITTVPHMSDVIDKSSENLEEDIAIEKNIINDTKIEKHAYLKKPWIPIPTKRFRSDVISKDIDTEIKAEVPPQQEVEIPQAVDSVQIDNLHIKKLEGDYFEVNDKKYSKEVFNHMWPGIAKQFDTKIERLQADNVQNINSIKSFFGTKFVSNPNKGDLFLRVDFTPNKLYKFNGSAWIEVDKNKTDAYSYDDKYIEFVIEKLQTGEYEIEQLTTTEQDLVAERLKNTNAKTKT
jgi:hypothetical protein